MKFLRYGEAGHERPGFLDDTGRIRDLTGQIDDLAGEALLHLDRIRPDGPVVDGAPRLGPPVARPGKIVCIGRNYAEHAAEQGAELPPEPLIFLKATSSMQGPNDPVRRPRGAEKLDWEVELGVVIGRPAKYVTEAEAPSHVAGYLAVNDVTERDFQKHRAGQWTKGKSCDTFGPMGPWLVTPDELGDPQALGLKLSVNGELRQNGSTADMIFGVAQLIAYLSQFFTLETGDIIATGTPSGVGAGMVPPRFLEPGDEMVLEIDGLGRQSIRVEQD